jgi:hypothetical protein
MASLSFITDVTKPLDTSNRINRDRNNNALTKEQLEAMKATEKLNSNLVRSVPADSTMELDDAIQESMPWTKVTNKKEDKAEDNKNINSTMKKVRVTFTIRSSKNSDFNPAKLHVDTLHESHKFDDSLIVFNTNGDHKVNIKSAISELCYKEIFKPMEKAHSNGIVTVSISHYIYLTEKAGKCKEAIFPFIKKNKIFIYFNPKTGLKHFTAIGVLFGPNPDYIWRDELADLLIEMMKVEINQEEQEKLGTTEDGTPKILLSLNTQTLGISKPVATTTVALEIRVPTGQERTYTNILERLYEKSEADEIIIPSKLGKFFPYYMKSKMQEVFMIMMRKQNADMQETAIIPIFGYTPSARQQQININGENTTVELALATTENIIRIKVTPSTWNLHKYLVVIKKENKPAIQKTIQSIFHKIMNTLENQPTNFPTPRCGGSEMNPAHSQIKSGVTIKSNYMTKLENIVLAQNLQDAGPSPPKHYCIITISYASAVKAGILKQPGTAKSLDDSNNDTNTNEQNLKASFISEGTSTQQQVSWESTTMDTSRSAGSSLSCSVTNSKI